MSRPPVYRVGLVALGLAVVASAMVTTSAAHATEAAPLHTVLWEITSTTPDVFLTPQVYVATLEADDTSHWISDATLKCGTRYQADAYAAASVAALIADGLLHGGEDQGIAQHWLVFETAPCPVIVAPPLAPPAPIPPVVSAPADPVAAPPAPPAPTNALAAPPAPDAASAPPAGELAQTGVDVDFPGALGLALLGAGLLILLASTVLRRTAP